MESTITVLAGRFGSGKTNLALNLALDARRRGQDVTVVDLDIINPYFRVADGAELLKREGISLISPRFANTNVDIPALPPEIAGVFEAASRTGARVIADVGGDDSGAVALGRYAAQLEAYGYEMLLVINRFRPFTETADGVCSIAAEIEAASRMKFTAIASNSNLARETTAETILSSAGYADEISRRLELPVAFTAVREDLVPQVCGRLAGKLLPVNIFTKPGWEIW